ncbi:MAG: hypothetical protein GQ531_04475 [Sulfurovum sp.]|nr:hypothetical protein [Sulfurovum sp.]
MKIFKYLIFAGIMLTLWITKPMWMPKTNYHRSADTSQVDDLVKTQKEERNALLKAQDKEIAALEKKFGPKSSVMKILKKHLREKYTEEEKFELLPCSPVREGTDGWTTVCAFRLKGSMGQDTYTINHGVVTQH